MPITDDQLDNFRKHRSLIALERNDFDDQPLQAFILGIGEKLVVLRNIRDFGNDGLFILRKEDITHVTYRETDRAQKVMIEADGILDDSDFDCDLPLDSWAELLAALPKDDIIILEDERPPEEPLFFIGRIIAIEPLNVRGRYFTGAANWEDEPWEIDTSEITSCQIDSPYIRGFKRHFERRGD